jgi:hypothetical protein
MRYTVYFSTLTRRFTLLRLAYGPIYASMNDYMQLRMGIPADQIPILRRVYFRYLWDNAARVAKHYTIDTDEFLRYVHDLPIEQVLVADQDLRDVDQFTSR